MKRVLGFFRSHGILYGLFRGASFVFGIASSRIFPFFFPYNVAVSLGIGKRPNYAYCCLNAALLAKKLNISRISAIEFGCAGGRGLLDLEDIAKEVEEFVGVKIDIYGFDTGSGLPPPKGYRDLPYHWQEGFFAMDKIDLEGRLKKAEIVLGDVKETSVSFIEKYDPAPIGCMFHDLDYYSSTKDSFQLLATDCEEFFLPRVYNYFDDIVGSEIELYNEYTGELLAISDFNEANSDMKFAAARHLVTASNAPPWFHQIRILHFFNHRSYNTFIGAENQQIPL